MCPPLSAAEDLDGLTDGELLERVADLVAEQDRLTARVAAAVRRAEHRQAAEHDGPKSMSAWLRTLDAVGGEKVATALEAVAAAGRCEGDTRGRAQRLADALVQPCDLALASGSLPVLRTVERQLLVTIPLADLTDPATGPGAGTTGTGAVISAARKRWVACDAGLTRLGLGPDSAPVDVGRSQRLVPPHLRRALEIRDGGCVFTGCTAPAQVVRRPPPARMDQRRPDQPGRHGAALRTPPHQGRTEILLAPPLVAARPAACG